MTRLLITGASGLLGANLALEAADACEVVAVSHRQPLAANFATVQADLTSPNTASRLIETHHPDWVVNCAALTDVDHCEAEPVLARTLNVEAPRQLALAAARAGAHMVHISTDAVFDGARGGYREDDPARPINAYGRTKLEGEHAVLGANPQALVVRTNFYGWSPSGTRSLAEWFLGRLEAGETCGGFTDVEVSLLLVNDLAQLLLLMLRRGLSGVYHIGGADCLSKYEFGRRLAAVFALDPDLVQPITADEIGLRAPRPKRLCLQSQKLAETLDVKLPEIDAGLLRMRTLREGAHPAALHALVGGKHAVEHHPD